MIPSVITLPFHFDSELPLKFRSDDNRYPSALVEYFVSRFSNPGDIVFDPFTGYGTTLFVSKHLGREVVGTEIDQSKIEYLSTKLKFNKEIFYGDVRRVIKDLPELNFVMTSPPYATKDEDLDPFTNYQVEGNYEEYLSDVKEIFQLIKLKMKTDSYLVVEVANLKNKEEITTLAWDIGKILSNVFEFKGEVIVNWQAKNKPDGNYGYGYDHSYCLIFLAS